MKRYSIFAVLFFLGLGIGALLRAYDTQEALRAEVSQAVGDAEKGDGHCGCFASKAECEQPCVSCCGPNGMADCFNHPNPSAKCCGR